MVRALYIGRFQPLHKGHVYAIKQILSENDALVIAIGSSNVTNRRNPIPAGARARMLGLVLRAEGIANRCVVMKIPDFDDDGTWARHVMSAAKPDIAYTNNPVVARCLRGFVPVKKLKMLRPSIFKGSVVRSRMRRGERWEHLVPSPVADYLKGGKLVRKKR